MDVRKQQVARGAVLCILYPAASLCRGWLRWCPLVCQLSVNPQVCAKQTPLPRVSSSQHYSTDATIIPPFGLLCSVVATNRWWDRCIKPSGSSSSSSSGTGPHHTKQAGAAREAYDSVMAHHDSPNWGGATGREADEAMPLTSDASQTGLRMSSSGYERGDDGGHGGAIASQHSP